MMMKMKRKLAMMLSILMLATACAPAALAEDAGLVEFIEPAGAGGEQTDPVTPVSDPPADLVAPVSDPPAAPAAPVNDPPADPPKQVAAPGASVSTSEDTVTVTLSGESGLAIYADLDGDTRMDLRAGDTVTFSGLAAGEYGLEVDYHDVQKGVSAFRKSVSVAGKPAPQPDPQPQPVSDNPPPSSADPIVPSAPAAPVDPIVPASEGQNDAPKQVAAPSASITTSEDTVTVKVSGEAGLEMGACVGSDFRANLYSGDSVTFNDLAAGEYEVEVDYMEPQGVSPFSGKVTVAGKQQSDPQPPQGGGSDGTQPQTWAAISANVTSSEDTVTVAVSGEIGPLLLVTLGSEKRYDVDSGSTVTFSGLAAGEYDLTVEYMSQSSGVSPYTAKVKVEGKSSGQTTPPSGGNITEVTPPSGGQTPPSGGSVDLITPPSGGTPSTPSKVPTVDAIGAKVGTGDDWIEVTITAADNWPLYIAVGNDFMQTASVGETVRFKSLPAGQYDIEVDYMQPVSGVQPFRSSTSISSTASYARDFIFSATGGQSSIDVIVSEASTLPIAVRLLSGSTEVTKKTIAGGVGKVTFDGLAKGTYSVELNYDPAQTGIAARTMNNIVVTGTIQGVTIQSVTAGENTLTVTGTAHPNTDIALTTEPAASSAYIVRSDNNGAFSAAMTLQAGTYTKVTATYIADNTITASKTGSFVVTAPATKPDLTVDPITNKMTRVVAKTAPGVTVNLRVKAYNYGQTVVADASGILRYSLPQTYPKGTEVTFTIFYGAGNTQSYTKTLKVIKGIAYKTLSYGDTGDEVEAMTERLRDLGYMDDDVRRYSSAVREAVKTFQRINGLDPDGVAGQETLELLFSAAALPYGSYSGVYLTLSRGDRGSLVRQLQQRLKDLGYYTIAVDGIYGSGTERAVRHFQRINGLPKTGEADSATQQLLFSSSAKAADSASADDYKTLSRSSKYHPAVVPMQRRLKALGYPVGSADGYFGSNTYRAVRDFQKRNGLKVTGVADEETQRVLFSSGAIAASGSSSSSSSSGYGSYRLLSWGSRGDDVVRLQKTLLSKGYKQVRVADGVYGQWTYDAVRAFQKDHRLSVDGIAGDDTQNALYGTNY